VLLLGFVAVSLFIGIDQLARDSGEVADALITYRRASPVPPETLITQLADSVFPFPIGFCCRRCHGAVLMRRHTAFNGFPVL